MRKARLKPTKEDKDYKARGCPFGDNKYLMFDRHERDEVTIRKELWVFYKNWTEYENPLLDKWWK